MLKRRRSSLDKMSTLIQNLAVKLANKELQITNLEVENNELKEQIEWKLAVTKTEQGSSTRWVLE